MLYTPVKKTVASLTGADTEDLSSLSPLYSLLSGGLVGALSVIVNNPIDVVKNNVQASNAKYTGSLAAFQGVLKESGPAGFAKGLTARVPRVFMGQAITFAVYEEILKTLMTVTT
jgi:hypothetical protein